MYTFLSLYEQVVGHCEFLIPDEVLAPMQANKGRCFTWTLELLKCRDLVPDDLLEDLTQLYCYHSCVLSCANLSAKQEMCGLAQSILERLLHSPEEAPGPRQEM